jgi:hypothetical protein
MNFKVVEPKRSCLPLFVLFTRNEASGPFSSRLIINLYQGGPKSYDRSTNSKASVLHLESKSDHVPGNRTSQIHHQMVLL